MAILFLIILLLICPSTAYSATYNAASCSVTDVASAVGLATSGDTVTFDGNCTWSTALTLPSGITLLGTGPTTTVITSNKSGYLINASGTGWRVSSIGWVLTSGRGVISTSPTNSSSQWIVDNCAFRSDSWSDGSNGVAVFGDDDGLDGYGLIYSCTFDDVRPAYVFAGAAEDVTINAEWAKPLALGTENAVYVEDCTIRNTSSINGFNAIDSNGGGRYVFRYNTVYSLNVSAHSVQGSNRASRSWEIYGNKFDTGDYSTWTYAGLKGGTGVVFYNDVATSYGASAVLDNDRSCTTKVVSGLCDGNSTWDGNTDGGNGYPCRDQIGRSTDAFQWNGGIPTQALAPAYFYQNWKGASAFNSQVSVGCANLTSYHILANRDFYNYSATFNGTTGVGCGTLASRPATCTTGVGYWSTDQSCSDLTGMVGASPSTAISGTLYKCTSTDTWTSYYTPYTYPHPLRGTSPTTSLTSGSLGGQMR